MPKRKLYMVYDNQSNDERIGSFTPNQANQLFGIKRDRVAVYATNSWRYERRYLFVAEPYEHKRDVTVDSLCADWDFTTAALKAMAGGVKHGS